eukprot:6212284-Pleurochrysis_carterae.AAC.4
MSTRIAAAVAIGVVGAYTAAYALAAAASVWRRRRAERARKLLLDLLPKVELHVHLDGAFDTPTLYALGKARARRLCSVELKSNWSSPHDWDEDRMGSG